MILRVLRRGHRDQQAQSLAEFAIIAPLLFILVFGIIDFGMGLRAYIGVSTATREGARYAAVGNDSGTFTAGGVGDCDGSDGDTIVARVCSRLAGLDLDNLEDVTVSYPNGEHPGNSVRVTAEYQYEYITPVKRIVSLFSAGAMSDHITLSSSTDMRIE